MAKNGDKVSDKQEIVNLNTIANGEKLTVVGIGKALRKYYDKKTDEKSASEVILLKVKDKAGDIKIIQLYKNSTTFEQVSDFVTAEYDGKYPVNLISVEWTFNKVKGNKFDYYAIEELNQTIDIDEAFTPKNESNGDA